MQALDYKIYQLRQSTFTQNSDQLDCILQFVRQQIERWGSDAKWKIDLVLTEPSPAARTDIPPPGSITPSQHPHHHSVQPQPLPLLSSPVPPSILPNKIPDHSLPVSTNTQFPWDYVPPYLEDWSSKTSEQQEQLLRESLERNQYLRNIIHSQSEQLRYTHPLPPDANKTIETMKQVYIMSENEQRLSYHTETKMLHKDIQTLSKKLVNLKEILQSVEDMELLPEDDKLSKEELLEDRKQLLRKIHLSNLRLKAREAELDYFQDLLKSREQQQSTQHYDHTNNNLSIPMTSSSSSSGIPSSSITATSSSSPKTITTSASTTTASHHKSPRFTDSPRNRPYLFQQQYSPKMRSDIRPATAISGLDSLGILADQMLSDPGFESQNATSSKTAGTNITNTTSINNDNSNSSTVHANIDMGVNASSVGQNQSQNDKSQDIDKPIISKRQQQKLQLQQQIHQQQQALKKSLTTKRHLYSIYDKNNDDESIKEGAEEEDINYDDDNNNRLNEKRSKKSIDSANALLSIFPTRPQKNEDIIMNENNEKPRTKSTYVRWTPEEDELLRKSVEINGIGNWDKIAKMVPNRYSQQCRQRWNKYLHQKKRIKKSLSSSPPNLSAVKLTQPPSSSPSIKDARHSPSIAALLNTTTTEEEEEEEEGDEGEEEGEEEDEEEVKKQGDNNNSNTSFLKIPNSNAPSSSLSSSPPLINYPAPNTSSSSSSSLTSSHPHSSSYQPPSPITTPKNQRELYGGLNRT
ncbi:unnamed protein product [Cunninghamella echinulata]